ncbi:uncharacterized protein BX663DRAFT_143318 [Cokeromyces recurvatus]|uniref:uncharacterized protein n=1 Tax=Cokeromyces recurvatus TaxID=90255 RepID=UPI0022209DCD|nr:uncharacterized protein BX663DRAFT_143318 [Cokeromyces recurvatus]KAI7901035.1 hypothetical protein BX663DRAFT_143318 [Cokeromyces recurvatus]
MAKIVDRAIWNIGPIFIGIAIILLEMCTLAFYLVIFPYNHTWTDTFLFNKLYTICTLLFTLYIVYCIHFHYYMAIATPPGDMKDYRLHQSTDAASILDEKKKKKIIINILNT